MEQYDNSDVVLISTVFGTPEHVDCRKVFWKQGALDVQVTTSFGINTLGNTETRRLTFFDQNVLNLM